MPRPLHALLPAALLLLAGCAAPPPDAADAGAPRFDPLAFFRGRSTGEAQLRILWKAGRPVHVESAGRMDPDGVLILDQRIAEGDKPARMRQWRIRAAGPDRYTGTLTDAQGPVAIETSGNRLHIAFAGTDGLRYEQWLALARDGRSAHNILVARKFGFVLGRLDETIRRAGPAPGGGARGALAG